MSRGTAVDFLVEELEKYENGKSEYFSKVSIINRARRMERDQIEKSFDSGWSRCNTIRDRAYITAEDHGKTYYTETYG